MSLLDHPEAQAILADAVVTPDAVAGQADRLTSFLQRFLPQFYRVEQRATATLVIRGRLGGLQRKPIQFFVGSGKWDDEAFMAELRQHVREELADPDGVVIEELFGVGKGEVGLDHDEVQSWVGWHHHMTLSLVALWFLCLERRQVRGKNSGDDRAADAKHPVPAAPRPAARSGGNRGGGQPRTAA